MNRTLWILAWITWVVAYSAASLYVAHPGL